MIDGKNLLDQRIKMITYDNIRKIATGQGDDNETGCKLDCPFFKKYYKMITINFSNHYWQCERNHFQFFAKNRNAIVNLFCLISRQNNQDKITQYNTLSVKLSNELLNKLKSRIKNTIEIILHLSSNVIGDSNDEELFHINYY